MSEQSDTYPNPPLEREERELKPATYEGRRFCTICKRDRAFVNGRCVMAHEARAVLTEESEEA